MRLGTLKSVFFGGRDGLGVETFLGFVGGEFSEGYDAEVLCDIQRGQTYN
jgi:hypothetical protein